MIRLKTVFTSKMVITGVFVSLMSLATVLFAPAAAQAQAIQDCSANSIIKCGAASPADLIAKIKAANPADLPAIYSHFNLTPDRYDAFARQAKMGMANRNGDIVVDGKVVARNAWSIGRQQFSYSQTYPIGSSTYHRSDSTEVLRQDLPVMAWFNTQGKLEIAVLAACGNPMGGDIVTPPSAGTATCRELQVEPVTTNTSNSYRFTTDAPVVNGGTISRVVYDFGDGITEQRTTPGEAVTHTYARAGSFTAKVTVYAKGADGKEIAINGNGCVKKITVQQQQPAAWQCTFLRASRQLNNNTSDNNGAFTSDVDVTSGGDGNQNYLAYTIQANTTSSNARLSKADFDFGDGSAVKDVMAAGNNSNAISTNHTYAQAGNYTASATVYFEPEQGTTTQGKDASATCQTSFTINQPDTPAAATPAVATPVAQVELPKTGPAGAIGLFGGASAIGAVGYRWRLRRRLNKVDQLLDSIQRN